MNVVFRKAFADVPEHFHGDYNFAPTLSAEVPPINYDEDRHLMTVRSLRGIDGMLPNETGASTWSDGLVLGVVYE